jgi:hypothetical protein
MLCRREDRLCGCWFGAMSVVVVLLSSCDRGKGFVKLFVMLTTDDSRSDV